MQIEKLHWQETLAIRQEVLWPHKPQTFCHLKDDEIAWHYGVFIDQKLVCVASVFPETNTHGNHIQGARLRKFATLACYQKQGIGSFVLSHIIDDLKVQDINYFWLDARESALAFYQRFGFTTKGAHFYKGDIPYLKMHMHL